MSRTRFVLPTLFVMSAAIAWGCSRPADPVAAEAPRPDPVKPLEARVAKLEHDLRTLAAANAQLRDQLRAADEKAVAAEGQTAAVAAQLRAAAARAAKLDGDLRAMAAVNVRVGGELHATGTRAAMAEGQAATLAAKLRAEEGRARGLLAERDDARAVVRARTGERDAAAAQLDGFRRALRDLLGQAEAAGKPTSPTAAGGPRPAGL